MKKVVSLLSAVTLTAVFAGSALAAKVTPEYTYECAKLTKAVTADGKVDAGEWTMPMNWLSTMITKCLKSTVNGRGGT